MKRLLAILAIFLLAPGVAWGAIAATTVWEIQTGGTNLNGCGFNPSHATVGSDYTQQAAAQLALTDLATGDPWTTVTSVAGVFTVAMNGNLIHIASGTNFLAGWYEVTYVDANTITVDRACGSVGAASSGVGNIGGACKIADTLDGDMFAAVTAGNTIYIKDGDYTAGEAITGTAGGDGTPIKFLGYTTTRADAVDSSPPSGTDMPSIDMGANALTITTGFWDMRNIYITGTAAVVFTSGASGYFENCKFENTSGTADRVAITAGSLCTFEKCEFTAPAGKGLSTATYNHINNSYAHDSKYCIYVNSDANTITTNIIDTCSTAGIFLLDDARTETRIIGNILYGNNTGDVAINLKAAPRQFILNNLIADWDAGIAATGSVIIENFNAFYSNTSDGVTLGPNSFVSSGDPFATGVAGAAAGDFRINDYLKSKGSPGNSVLPGTAATSKGYTDIGALQTTGGGAWAN